MPDSGRNFRDLLVMILPKKPSYKWQRGISPHLLQAQMWRDSSPMHYAGITAEDHRASLSGESLDSILFLRENLLMANFALEW